MTDATNDPALDEWKTYDDFAHGIDTFRLPNADLAGTAYRLAAADGAEFELELGADARVRWRGPATGGEWHDDPIDAVRVRDDVVFLNIPAESIDRTAVTFMLSERTGRGIVTVSTIAPEAIEGTPQVSQEFTAVELVGGTPSGEDPAPSRDLIGVRNLYRYSPSHLYEHVYLSSQRYGWQCIEGVQRGHGDTDLSTVWKLDDDLYLFCFREFRIPVASVWLHDFGPQLKTTGVFLGLGADGEPSHSRAGGDIIVWTKATYPGTEPV